MSKLISKYASWRRSLKNNVYTSDDAAIRKDFSKFAKLDKEIETEKMLELEKEYEQM
ncbi:hypothetical protein [Clostridium sp.]|uniref:hypothetical protein n=1 Tax=Clostridium sp. TaxID=1506 RepID=UPI002FC9F487